ncbi:hypothetical protein [Paenibacillus sp. Leaf72]|uniref:hypothetical protein n=1 Tax=Paenibacillus sp. Leaf72 TaxID=1736234 RepID=UPI0006FDF072|nr:hypothetical protein [Paenibacillus sp. Leaf72]KQN96834.1 hypothetical protein ASF12_22445 [Paenibacillus sp. Leaf72]
MAKIVAYMDTLATEVGQKLIIHKGIHRIHKINCLRNLYAEGDVVTVKSFSKCRYEYGTEYHIAELEEVETPNSVNIVIHPIEYYVIKECYYCSPRNIVRPIVERIYDLRYTYYCDQCEKVWCESLLFELMGQVLTLPADRELNGLKRIELRSTYSGK